MTVTMPQCSVDNCELPVKCKGLCQPHYRRMRAGVPLEKPIRKAPAMNHEARFWANVHKNDACWLWIGPTQSNGYGMFSIRGRNIVAHRASYMFSVGPIPDGLELDHLCRVRNCVNPAHLEPVTRSVNVRRGIAADRTREWHAEQTHCPNGHDLTPENIEPGTIRRCRICRRESTKQYQQRRRQSA